MRLNATFQWIGFVHQKNPLVLDRYIGQYGNYVFQKIWCLNRPFPYKISFLMQTKLYVMADPFFWVNRGQGLS